MSTPRTRVRPSHVDKSLGERQGLHGLTLTSSPGALVAVVNLTVRQRYTQAGDAT
jgi:hypothetical protein